MAGFLLDTNVLSELVRAQPERRVVAWTSQQQLGRLFLSSITLGELTRSVLRLSDGQRRERLARWLEEELPSRIEARILPFDEHTATVWGRLMADGDRGGRPRPALDMQIAAIALRHDLSLATRNESDFVDLGLPVINPWRWREPGPEAGR